ncbi:MAG: hypothetical protein RhofKO_11870 [Rhodothermales bacterium]
MTRQERKIADAFTTTDLWRLMEQRVPPIVSEYFRGGADAETTLRANVRAFQQAATTARSALRFGDLDCSTTVAGHKLDVPWLIAPIRSLRTIYPRAYSAMKGDSLNPRSLGHRSTAHRERGALRRGCAACRG